MMQVTDGAAKPRRGQVQRGNTSDNSPSKRRLFFSWPPKHSMISRVLIAKPVSTFAEHAVQYVPNMESTMRMVGPAILVAVCGMLACGPARADIVPPIKGNDTGGIIAYELATQTDVKLMAVEHCARYAKVVRLRAAQGTYGWCPFSTTPA